MGHDAWGRRGKPREKLDPSENLYRSKGEERNEVKTPEQLAAIKSKIDSHTPGPWTTDGDRVGRIVPKDNKFFSVAAVGGFDHEELKANARLIAAAPQLLQACRAIIKWIELDNQDDPVIEELTLTTVSELAMEAIEKAEGKR